MSIEMTCKIVEVATALTIIGVITFVIVKAVEYFVGLSSDVEYLKLRLERTISSVPDKNGVRISNIFMNSKKCLVSEFDDDELNKLRNKKGVMYGSRKTA